MADTRGGRRCRSRRRLSPRACPTERLAPPACQLGCARCYRCISFPAVDVSKTEPHLLGNDSGEAVGIVGEGLPSHLAVRSGTLFGHVTVAVTLNPRALSLPLVKLPGGSPTNAARTVAANHTGLPVPCLGSSTPWSPSSPHRRGAVGVAFDRGDSLGAPELVAFDAQLPRPSAPLSTLRLPPHSDRRMTRGEGGRLLLPSTGLPPAPPPVCLAHHRPPTRPRPASAVRRDVARRRTRRPRAPRPSTAARVGGHRPNHGFDA